MTDDHTGPARADAAPAPEDPSHGGPGSSADRVEDLRSKIAAASAQLTETRRRRMVLQRASVSPDTLSKAIADAHRDRDAGTSPQVEESRERADALIRRLLNAWAGADRIRLRLAQLALAELPAGALVYGPELLAALDAEAQLREQIAQRLAEVGLDGFPVPQPIPTLSDVRSSGSHRPDSPAGPGGVPGLAEQSGDNQAPTSASDEQSAVREAFNGRAAAGGTHGSR